MNRVVALPLAVVADRLLGEPPTPWHPVAWFGTAMTALERHLHADRYGNGLAYTAAGVALGASGGVLVRRLLGPLPATAVATAIAVAGRMLDDEACGIAERLHAGDLDGARCSLRALVGRTPDELDEAAISRAVVESVAENTVDAVTASLFWAAIGGAPAVLAHRAVNTMDAMVGHRTERYRRFGWASARLDDVVAWLPARLTAAVTLAPGVRHPRVALATVAAVRQQARAHPSPNGGLVEASFAHRLGVTIGGTNRYGDRFEERGTLGAGPAAGPGDIVRAVALRRRVSDHTTLVLLAASAAVTLCRRSRRRP